MLTSSSMLYPFRSEQAGWGAFVASHEIGHSLGLPHVEDRGNLMYTRPGAHVMVRFFDTPGLLSREQVEQIVSTRALTVAGGVLATLLLLAAACRMQPCAGDVSKTTGRETTSEVPEQPRDVQQDQPHVPTPSSQDSHQVQSDQAGHGRPAGADAGEQPSQRTEQDLEIGRWHILVEGLDLAVFDAPRPSSIGDSRIRVLRVDPAHHDVVLLSTHAGHGPPRTPRSWAEDHGLLVVTNPGMFLPDRRSVGHMRIGDHLVNSRWNRDRAVFATGSRSPEDPPLRIIDDQCDDRDEIAASYRSVVQSIRVISCRGSNVWTQQPRIWSHAVYGTDAEGRLLLVHARSPWSTHDFVSMLQELPLRIERLMYGEGGPEAQLLVSTGSFEAEWLGSYETGFFESDENMLAWDLPNVLGVRPQLSGPAGN